LKLWKESIDHISSCFFTKQVKSAMTRTQNMKFYSYHINKKISLKLSFLLPNLKGKKIATTRGKAVHVRS
jgi:hypothetical protein